MVPGVVGVEARQHLTGGARPQRTANNIDDSVHVVQGQTQHYAILGRPLPSLHQAHNLRRNVAMGCDYALRSAGRATGVENHGTPLTGDIRGDARQLCRLASRELVIGQRTDATGGGNWRHPGGR